MTMLPTQNTPSVWELLTNAIGGGAEMQQTPVNPVSVSPQAPQGFKYADPIQDMGFLGKLGMAMGGIENMNNYRQQAYNRQLGQYEQNQKDDRQQALQDIAARMQTGELDRESALMEYAQRTGDYSKMFQKDATPAAIKEYQFVQGLDPEQRALYFRNKRSNQMFDRGGSQVLVSPEGQVVAEYGKTLAPEQNPALKFQQAQASEQGKQGVQLQADIAKKIRDASDVVDLAGQAEEYLPDASGSYVDSAFSFGKKVIGRSDRETQANAALKVISGKLVSNMPRMEGPQSDKDVQLYKDMAANIADPTVPAEDKKVALQALRDLNGKYASKQTNMGGYDQVLPPPRTDNAPASPKVIDFGSLD